MLMALLIPEYQKCWGALFAVSMKNKVIYSIEKNTYFGYWPITASHNTVNFTLENNDQLTTRRIKNKNNSKLASDSDAVLLWSYLQPKVPNIFTTLNSETHGSLGFTWKHWKQGLNKDGFESKTIHELHSGKLLSNFFTTKINFGPYNNT